MKHLNTIVMVLLNVLFCTVTLWFFTRNSLLRPFSGSFPKEFLTGLLLLGTLYVNYFLLYPKLRHHYPNIYWLALVLVVLIASLLELAIAHKGIALCNAQVIQIVGAFHFFSTILLIIIGRSLALNFFPYLVRERQHFQQAFDNEVKVVYKKVRMLDVTDTKSDIQLINIDDIFYCLQQRNFTEVYTVQNQNYTRLGSMKHLEQLLGDDFIRITNTELVPLRYIKDCKENTVIMKKMPWEEESTSFKLEPQKQEEVAERVLEGLMRFKAKEIDKNIPERPARPKTKRKPVKPHDEKLKAVYSFIKKQPNCNTGNIIAKTKIPLSTVERCIAVLKKRGLIEYTGSRKTGGYRVVKTKDDSQNL